MALAVAHAPLLSDSAHQAHHAFRAVMAAMSRPGKAVAVSPCVSSPSPLAPATAAVLLALADFETAVWLDPVLTDVPDVGEFLRFQSGCRVAADPDKADFAVIADAGRMPRLSDFAQGTLEYPDRSTTILIQVQSLNGTGWLLQGPGVQGETSFSAHPLPMDFVSQLQSNRRTFPCGVDIVLIAGSEIAALPRSTRVSEVG